MSIKQVIVMRTDLNMRKGKMVVQGAHASMGIAENWPSPDNQNYKLWLKEGAKKICVGVDTYPDLILLYDKARAIHLPTYLVVDAGFTEFKEPTTTCLAIGPGPSEEIDKITGHLKLL